MPLFLNSHVFVNVSPGFIFVLSGMVTSRNNTALSVQLTGAVTASVGAMVISGTAVKVAGTKPGFVGIKVAVIKFGRDVSSEESTEMEMQEERNRVSIRIIFLFIMGR